MTSISWMYGRGVPLQQNPLQVQSTAFASSSLSSQAKHEFAMDYGKGVPHRSEEVKGLPMSGATFNNEDRSSLGVDLTRRMKGVTFSAANNAATTPNVDSLSRSQTQLGSAPRIQKFNSVK
jgi:hypothetical protein